jgi:hypothetical protein
MSSLNERSSDQLGKEGGGEREGRGVLLRPPLPPSTAKEDGI